MTTPSSSGRRTNVDDYIAELFPKSIEELEKELEALDKDEHPILRELKEETEQKKEFETLKNEVTLEHGIKRIQTEHDRRNARLDNELRKKLKEIKEDAWREFMTYEKQTEADYFSVDINKSNVNNVVEVHKKTLRGRGGGTLIEPPSYLTAPTKQTNITVVGRTKFLLDDYEIQHDLAAVFGSNLYNTKSKKVIEAHLNKPKLVYDGRTYKTNEECLVWSTEYSRFPAKIEHITDTVVFLKGTQAWDTRQIQATRADLIEGRVKLTKKK